MSLATIAWSFATAFACTAIAQAGRIDLGALNFIVSTFGAAFGVLFYALSTRRLRDLNFPGWTVKFLAFPLLGVIVLPVLCFLSGPRWTNDFGDPPLPSGFLKVAASLMLFVAAMPISHWALTTYFETRHLLLAKGV